MNRIDRRIQEVTALVDEGMRKHWPRPSLAAKARARIEQLETMNVLLYETLRKTRDRLAAICEASEGTEYDLEILSDLKQAIEKARQL